jgi:hypothetical protein
MKIILILVVILAIGVFAFVKLNAVSIDEVPLFTLGSDYSPLGDENWKETATEENDEIENATQVTFESELGRIHVSVLDGKIVQVIYNLFGKTHHVKDELFDHYKQESEWVFFTDNGFGEIYKRKDEKYVATWNGIASFKANL